MLSVRWPNSAPARLRACGVRAETICGSDESSSIAFPSATRSGQKATETSLPAEATMSRIFSVVPG